MYGVPLEGLRVWDLEGLGIEGVGFERFRFGALGFRVYDSSLGLRVLNFPCSCVA